MAERTTDKSWQEGLLVARAAEEAAKASRHAPAGFAAVDAPPLDPRPSAPAMTVPGALATPQQIAPPEQPGPPLVELRPAPPQSRDPREPFPNYAAAMSEVDRSAWQPTQPLTTLTSTENLRGSTGWASGPAPTNSAALPPPTDSPTVATGRERGPAQLLRRPLPAGPGASPAMAAQVRPANSRFPSNPYASGLYSPPPAQPRRGVPGLPQGRPPFPPPAGNQRRG